MKFLQRTHAFKTKSCSGVALLLAHHSVPATPDLNKGSEPHTLLIYCAMARHVHHPPLAVGI